MKAQIFLLLAVLTSLARAAEPVQPPQTDATTKAEASNPAGPKPPAYKLSIAHYSDRKENQYEWIFIIGDLVYRSLDEVKTGITHFPPGSSLTWAPSCIVKGGEPLKTAEELKGLEEHCKSHDVRFILIPAG